jgi:Ca-activated chloride channel homolog
MNSRVILRASLFIISLATCPPLIAQEAIAPAQTSSSIVNLNLIVTDRAKHSRDDVNKDGVQVLEDGIEQTISTFSKDERPVNYVVAIDTSGSFKNILTRVLDGVRLLLEANKENDETMLIRFISSDKIETVDTFTTDKSKLIADLKLFKIEGGQSAVIDAIYLAVQAATAHKGNDSSIRRAVVLISDGEDRASYYTTDQLTKLLRAGNVQVFVVGVVTQLDDLTSFTRPSQRETAEKLLNRVARETGGRVFFPKTLADLAQAMGEIIHDLRTQYVISYESKNNPSKDNFRKIEVKIKESPPGSEKLTAITKPGYFIKSPDLEEKDKKKKSK